MFLISLNAEIVAYYSENRTTSRIWKVLLNRVYSPKGGIGGVLSMRMQVILDSRFACPGSAPIRDEKKGEFREDKPGKPTIQNQNQNMLISLNLRNAQMVT